MSTAEATPRSLRGRIRLRTRLLVVSALVAVGATALVLALAGSNHVTTPHPAIRGAQPWPDTPLTAVTAGGPGAQPWPDTPLTAGTSAGTAGHFRNVNTHALPRVRSAARNARPTRASELARLSPRQRQYVLGLASLSPAQLAAAYGTGR
jgi:hypothetical protein